jgi:hypothetical protein
VKVAESKVAEKFSSQGNLVAKVPSFLNPIHFPPFNNE